MLRRTLRSLNWTIGVLLLTGAGLGVVISTLFATNLVFDASAAAMSDLADKLVLQADAEGRDIRRAFTALSTIAVEPCSEGHRQALRRIVLVSHLIKDIGYQQDGFILCTFGLGRLPKPMPVVPKGFETEGGVQLATNVEVSWAPGVKLTVIRKGSYSLSLHQSSIDNATMPRDVAVSRLLVNRATARTAVAAGAEIGVTVDDLQSGASRWRDGRLVVVDCSKTTSVCFGLSSSWLQILTSSGSVLLALATAGGVIGTLTAAGGLSWQKQRRSLESRLYRTLKRKELFLVYQPIVDARTGSIISAEALMRWRLPDGQFVPPEVFLPVALAGGFGEEVTCFAIHQVSRDLGNALRADPQLCVTINITAGDLASTRLLLTLEQRVLAKGILANQVALELTEQSALVSQIGRDAMQALREKGFRIYIDDFGTGYSSLSYLKDLAVDAIKIDKSFTEMVGTDSPKIGLVSAMLNMAKSLSVAVIVEGVETEAQAAYFRKHKVAMMQGWLFGHPADAAELIASLPLRV